MASEELVTEQFQFLGIEVQKKVLSKCVSLCDEYNIDAESFTEQWMAFSLNHLNGASPDLENLDLFARREFSKLAVNRHNATRNDTVAGAALKVYGAPVLPQSDTEVLSNYMAVTPKIQEGDKKEDILCNIGYLKEFLLDDICGRVCFWCMLVAIMTRSILVCSHQLNLQMDNFFKDKRVKVEIESSNQNELCPATYSPTIASAKYASRSNAGTVVHSYGDEKLLQIISEPNGPNSTLNCNVTQVPNEDGDTYTKAMFGFELLHEKAGIYDSHIRYLSQYIMRKANITESTSVRHKSQTEVAVVGRIECDADARLNPKCVVLQGTWEQSLSQAVPVDIDNLKQYSLFPGQVVVMRGVNPRGDRFVAHEVFSDAALPLQDHRADMMNTLTGTLSMVVAAGPYTTSDNMSYEPLKDLVSYITTHKPHIVLLTGPFMDSEHSKVKDNTMAETFRSFFDKLVDSLGELNTTCPFTKIYLISSLKDAFHVNIYPSPPYHSRRKHPNIHFLPDPCTLNVNGVIVGVTSTDVLMHISQEEISLGTGGDKLSRLAAHVASQQAYLPAGGAAARAHDAALWAAHAHLPAAPHILVLPSHFRYFVKDVNGCMVVNPEHLTKGTGGGTFARILLSADKEQLNLAAQIVRI